MGVRGAWVTISQDGVSRHHLLQCGAFRRAGLGSAAQPTEQPLELVRKVFVHLSIHERHRKAAGERQQLGHASQKVICG